MHNTVIRKEPSCADDYDNQSLTVSNAREHIQRCLSMITDKEKLPLGDSLNRVLAEDIISNLNVPAHTNSAMDGYALAAIDLPVDTTQDLEVIGTAYAGAPFTGTCQSGQCIKIMTGAPLPAGTDTVVIQEMIETLSNKKIRIGTGHHAGQNVRLAGEDIAAGSVVLQHGKLLTPADLGIIASLGIGEVQVFRRPRVAFFSTGDELRSIGEPLAEGEIYDSNRYSLHGMLKRLDVEILDLGVVPDDQKKLREAFKHASESADIVITSGGVSVGEADYTKSVLSELGEINFWRIAMKPGRPLTFGKLNNATFFGLPGNPVAVMVTFYQFVLPAIYFITTGLPYQAVTLQARSENEIRKRPGRFEFMRGTLTQDSTGALKVTKSGRQGSGILTSMSQNNCFILLPEDLATVNSGELVEVQPFSGLI